MANDFDIVGALKSGYTPTEIADHLGTTRSFDVAGARKEGYTDAEIINHMTGSRLPANGNLAGLLKPAAGNYDPTDGMTETEKYLAGTGKGFVDLARGAGQMVGAVSRQDVQDSRDRDAALMNTRAGKLGDLTGTMAGMVSTAFLPGANTMAGAAGIGALTGLAAPSTSTGETLGNTALGGAMGPLSLGVGRGLGAAYQAGKSALEPLFAGGQQRIAARTLRAFAGSDKDAAAAAAALSNPPTTLPGIQPTTAEIAGNAGLAQLERGLRNNPEYVTALTKRNQANRGVMTSALQGIAGTNADRAAAVTARQNATQGMYQAANDVDVPADAALHSILRRPSAQSAWARAKALAAERGDQLVIPGEAPPMTASTARGPMTGGIDPLTLNANTEFTGMGSMGNGAVAPARPVAGSNVARGAIGSVLDPLTLTKAQPRPDVYSGKAIQYLKMAMNDIANTGPQNGMGSHEVGAVKGTLGDLNGWINDNVPALRAADSRYAALSQPINQMDVGRELSNRLIPALGDFGNDTRLSAASYAKALRDGDQMAANVTGRQNATLAGTMTPDQMGVTRQIAEQLARRANADELGGAVGSNTAQNLASQNVIRSFLGPLGMPQSLAERAAQSTLGQTVMRPAQWVGSLGEQNIRGLLEQAALDPKIAHGLLSMKPNSRAAKALWTRQGLLNATTVPASLAYSQEQ